MSGPQIGAGTAPHFENMLLASSAVLTQNGLPIMAMPWLLTDKSYRDMLLENVTDPKVVYYYKYRFDHWGRETADKVESILSLVRPPPTQSRPRHHIRALPRS